MKSLKKLVSRKSFQFDSAADLPRKHLRESYSSTDSVVSAREQLPGTLKTQYALNLKLDLDTRLLQKTVQLNTKPRVRTKARSKCFADVTIPTNRFLRTVDHKWHDQANPGAVKARLLRDQIDMAGLQRKRKVARYQNEAIMAQFNIPRPGLPSLL